MQAFIYLFILLSLIYHYVYLSGETSLRLAVFVFPESEECCHEEIRVN